MVQNFEIGKTEFIEKIVLKIDFEVGHLAHVEDLLQVQPLKDLLRAKFFVTVGDDMLC